MSRALKVVYWNNIPSPYFVERMSELADQGQLEIHAVFNAERNADRSWDVDPSEWTFESHWAPQGHLGLHDATSTVARVRPDLFVSLYGEPCFAVNGPRAARHARRWAIRVVPTFDAWERRSHVKEATKRVLGRLVDAAKVPGPDGRTYAQSLGVPHDRVFEIQQSVPVAHFGSSRNRRAEARAELGVAPDDFVFVYVGRLWEGKGLRTLLDACALLPQHQAWSLLVAGDGPMSTEIATRTDLPITALGFVQRPRMPSVLAASDCLLFPTLGDPFGLVVEEAFAAGVPVITSDQMGDAIRRVVQTRAGIIVSEQRPEAWAAAMFEVMSPGTQPFLARNAALRSSRVGHRKYASDFTHFAHRVVEMSARHRFLRSGLQGRDA